MSDRYNVVQATDLGMAFHPISGERYRVRAVKHLNALPGFPDENAFSVERTNIYGQVDKAWGFLTVEDCYRFLTTRGTYGFKVPDERGQLVTEERECLGIPDAAVRVDKPEIKSKA